MYLPIQVKVLLFHVQKATVLGYLHNIFNL